MCIFIKWPIYWSNVVFRDAKSIIFVTIPDLRAFILVVGTVPGKYCNSIRVVTVTLKKK